MRRVNLFILLLAVLIILSCFIGSVSIPFDRMFEGRYLEILKLRFFRAILAVVAGAGLSVAGVILQSVLRNPLSEPYVLGVSSGAGLGAVIGLLFFSTVFAGLTAFLGGIITIALVCSLARVDNRLSSENMIISGILINALFSSILMFFISVSSGTRIHSIIWWLLGNTQVYKGIHVFVVAVTVSLALFLSMLFSKELNALSLGEEEATHLGVNIDRVKKLLLVLAAFITSIIVSMCGIIGFVGLMVPHLTRRMVGPDHRTLILSSFVIGGIFLLLCDVISRTILAPSEIPVGVVTAFLGVPFFIYILRKSRKAYFK